MDSFSFFLFVRAVLPEKAPEPRLDGLTGFAGQFSQKLLAVTAIPVQNGRASS